MDIFIVHVLELNKQIKVFAMLQSYFTVCFVLSCSGENKQFYFY